MPTSGNIRINGTVGKCLDVGIYMPTCRHVDMPTFQLLFNSYFQEKNNGAVVQTCGHSDIMCVSSVIVGIIGVKGWQTCRQYSMIHMVITEYIWGVLKPYH